MSEELKPAKNQTDQLQEKPDIPPASSSNPTQATHSAINPSSHTENSPLTPSAPLETTAHLYKSSGLGWRLALGLGLLLILVLAISIGFVQGFLDELTTLALAGVVFALLIIIFLYSTWRYRQRR